MSVVEFPHQPIDLITIGRAGCDFYPCEDNKPFKEVQTFSKHVGGPPANVAVGLARLKKKVGILTRVSNDFIGEYIVDYLASEKVITELIQKDKNRLNSLALTQVKSPHDCGVVMYRKDPADLFIDLSRIDFDVIKKTKALLITGTALSHSHSLKVIQKILDLKDQYHYKIFFDLDYRPYNWSSREEVSTIYSEIAMKTDVLIGNTEEYIALENGMKDHQTLANYWLKNDTTLVIIKDGKNGSMAFTKDNAYYHGIYKTRIKKTYGAGDAFAAGLIYQLLENQSIEQCLNFGSAAASIVVQRRTCTEAMPTLEEVTRLMENNHVTNKEIQ